MSNVSFRFARFLAAAVSVSAFSLAQADAVERRGGDSIRQIVCTQGNTEIIRIPALAGQAQHTGEGYTLTVRALGDDLGSLTLTNSESGDSVEATRGEGFLSAKLITDEDPANPMSSQTTINVRGIYSLNFEAPSGDKVTISAGGRRGEQMLSVSLMTDESPNESLEISCRRER